MSTKIVLPEPTTVYRIKTSPPVMDFLVGKATVELALPPVFALGYRLFMVECSAGGLTGRASLCKITGYKGDLTVLARTWGWSQGKMDDDLSFLNLTVTPSDYPLVNARVIPVSL
jgi:hypothetical protein